MQDLLQSVVDSLNPGGLVTSDLLAQASQTTDPQLRTPVELIAVFTAALFGSVEMARQKSSAVGVMSAALVIGLGGGVIRDGLLLNIQPVAISTWYYIAVALGAGVLGGLTGRLLPDDAVTRVLRVAAAAVLLLSGATKAVDFGVPPLSVIAIGVITGMGGTIIFGLLSGVNIRRTDGIGFALAATAIGATAFLLLFDFFGEWPAYIGTIGIVVLLRVVGVARGWTVPILPGEPRAAIHSFRLSRATEHEEG